MLGLYTVCGEMAHTLILGITESGKTTLAKKLAANYKARNVPVLVLEPFKSASWGADLITDDPRHFLKVVFSNKSCAVFVDEGGRMIGRYSKVMDDLATIARHYGHNSHFITQRAAQISTTIRDQCVNVFAFKQSADDGKILANRYVDDLFLSVPNLRQGEYIAKIGFDGKSFKSKVF